jgi:hypothetical protein
LEEARRFRTDFGLRSDDAWIFGVARDPSSDRTTYGVPLTAAEIQELARRIRDVDQIVPLVITYGEAHPEEWGGAYIDQQAGGVLVAQFTARVDLHRLALFAQVSPNAKLEVRQVTWTQAQLEAAKERFQQDEPWFATIPADIRSVGLDIRANRVVAAVSSPNPNAPEIVLAHFGWGENLLQISSDGTGALLLPRGTLVVTVVDQAGRPVAGLRCAAYPDLAGATNPHPDPPLPPTDQSGTCVLDLRSTGYWVQIERLTEPPHVIAIARAVVLAGKSVSVQVVTAP